MAVQTADERVNQLYYEDNFAHLADELDKLDLLIQRRIALSRLKSSGEPDVAVSPSMIYIAYEEVERLLGQGNDFVDDENVMASMAVQQQLDTLQADINSRVNGSIEQGVFLALPQLAHLFTLSSFELQAIFICLAPELRRKYDKLYAFLQDDITRKKPSIDLILELLCPSEAERWAANAYFSEHSPLFQAGILQATNDPHSPSGSSNLARFLNLDRRILDYLLGDNRLDGRLSSLVKLFGPLSTLDAVFVDATVKTNLIQLTQQHFADQQPAPKKLTLHLYGPYGSGKRNLALGICSQLNCPLLYVDVSVLLADKSDYETMLRLLFREGLLLQAAVFLDNVDVLKPEADKSQALKKLARLVEMYGWLIFLAGENPLTSRGAFDQTQFHTIPLSVPNVPLREAVWQDALAKLPGADMDWARSLARQFRLTPGQIYDAVALAENGRALHNESPTTSLTDLHRACRSQSNQKLGELALKVDPHYRWDDIILPADKLAHLREICNQARRYYQIFDEWGFGQKISHGKGLSALFTGPPGTGKTMAAEVIAHELHLDLYKVDLSGVVSKYIGETEKNLARIFQEAETSNAILFFDEADALFGKRTEVSDAHDRYANIETSYLLQKMEEYEGVVVLATNLRENMDDAFTRRIRFIVEFPFPDEAHRREIWRAHFPGQAPMSDGIDYEFLARRFQIAGGNIKNVALNAAFLAAQNGGTIEMEHVLHGVQREFEKMGKLWNEHNFKL
ncbi:MAG: ATP-binding protein [Chloroflexi bacterium]|nr:ATP-binding protein [Chloroflexota bacterium]